MRLALTMLIFSLAVAHGRVMLSSPNTNLPVHDIARVDGRSRFENLAIRHNGQILATATQPNASVSQFDPLGILPPALVYTIPNIGSAVGIAERERDIFYVASGDFDIKNPRNVTPASYAITRIDMRGVAVTPGGTLTKTPVGERVASLRDASLPNGIAFVRPESDYLLVADSFRGLIWNVNVCTGEIGVTLNDSTTKGSAPSGRMFTGVNGIKVHNGSIYYTNTGRASLYSVPVDEKSHISPADIPKLIASNLSGDDLAIGHDGTAYVAGTLDIITKVSPSGEQEILTGSFNSTSSSIVGPTAVRFGRLESDRHSLYITTNGGITSNPPDNSVGISRIDLKGLLPCHGCS